MEIFRAERRKYNPTLTREEPHTIGTGKGHKLTFALTAIMGDLQEAHRKEGQETIEKKYGMIVVMLPCFLMAMYEKHGQPLEVVVKNIIQTKFVRPKERPYQTQNLYAVLEKQRKLEKEVSAIVKGNNQRRRTGKRPRKG